MLVRRIAPLFMVAGCVVLGFGQQSTAPPAANDNATTSQDVIVPWRHFGPAPAPDASAAAQTRAPDVRITEEDISKKHPHPPEPIQLPAPDLDVGPLIESGAASDNSASQAALPSGAGQLSSAAQNAPQSASGAASAPANNSPAAQVAILTEGYEKREADRQARRQQIEEAAAKDPATQALAQIQETRLLLEGEQDRMQSAQQLSQAFDALADELGNRAAQVRSKAENRKQMADAADTELDRLNHRMPRLELALRNFAMLPPSDDNDQMIRRLDSELNQNDETRKQDQSRGLQARHEWQLLQADAAELQREADEARQKSTSFAQSARDAQLNEGRLADRLEFSVTRQRAADMLNSTSKAIENSVALTGNTAIGPTVIGASTPSVPSGRSVDQLRDCIRKSGDVDACRAKGEH